MISVDLLKKVFLFQGFDDPELKSVAQIANEKEVIAGDSIFSEGQQATSLMIIGSGTIEILKRGGESEDQKVTIFSAGSHFGEMAFLDREPRAASAEAKENTRLVEIRFDDLESLARENQAIGLKLYRNLAQSLCRRIRQTTKDLSFLKELKLRQI